MKNLRKYGEPPYSVVAVHGGPGARGELAPVAKKIALKYGVLEALQDANTISGQVQELLRVVKKHATKPVILIGHSWGAWLSYIFTARYPSFVKKLVLVSSGPFEEKYVRRIMQARLQRLNKKERAELNTYIALMHNQNIREIKTEKLLKRSGNKVEFVKFGNLMSKTDSYEPTPSRHQIELRLDIIRGVWPKAEELRKTGQLLKLSEKIKCPVTAIHGDYDPHPWQGVKNPLRKKLSDFRFFLLKKCGHTPWLEKHARCDFLHILTRELT
ncbi:MAG: alpha/beta hydrolase [Candidatus Latescibacteria bacterium]|nr:alpha/beta hydrolase [Candidatus Latescibacterota bacterium]